ncbi:MULTISPECIES: membrane lipoprotein lipid attachment site-containing protein [Marinobacter]|uniref:Membrane lipoprotein lipid attachment site-containing protein n=1 Tax=Marinobacter xiaoshiensis TaxID=3073652 RepID=A0ABU2HGN9_9GAMM|nr:MULTISPECIES: membrane lipoprotein lipid attachment site-containing protein [unclassified Marinobacter]MBK1874308.1 membrane lipoprotein lipid attachment site-containing protein [Marinobacter sp. 1-3A]MBK1887483.1 membrane lipoprotein lipid attachment site-containing protein [Marinobacter sp. DY40_1A1]MDS1310240.1 membrane lipoprotein lipid attachment site-containing protein [Marinobacter sp. F60267]
MKKISLIIFVVLALAGCKDRVIWDDNGKLEEKTQNREIWDSKGKMNKGEREVWVNKDGEKVVK